MGPINSLFSVNGSNNSLFHVNGSNDSLFHVNGSNYLYLFTRISLKHHYSALICPYMLLNKREFEVI